MARKLRRIAAGLTVACWITGCGFRQTLTRPEGNGGWSPERRREEIAARALSPARAAPDSPVLTAGSAPLSWSQVLDLARRNSRRIAEGQAQLQAAAARVRDARGRLLPSTVGSGRYTWYTDELSNQIDLPPGILPPGESAPPIVIREAEAGTLNATLTLPFDLNGEILQTLAAAQAGYRGERARLWATTLEQQLAAVTAYFDLLEAQRLRQVTEQTIELDRQQFEQADARFQSGRATKNDLLVAQVALRNAEQQLIRRDLAIRRARWALNQIIGLDIDAPTEVVDVRSRPALPAIDDAIQRCRQQNPLVAALLEEQQRIEASTRALERSRLPRFSGGGAVDYTTSDIVQPQDIGSGFVGFVWDLGTDTRREAQIAQSRAETARARSALERQLRELETALRSVYASAEERLSALTAAEEAVLQAEENLRIRRQQFDAGRAQSDDVLLADALLAQQRATVASALYQAHQRRAELQELMGLPLEEIVE